MGRVRELKDRRRRTRRITLIVLIGSLTAAVLVYRNQQNVQNAAHVLQQQAHDSAQGLTPLLAAIGSSIQQVSAPATRDHLQLQDTIHVTFQTASVYSIIAGCIGDG